MYYPDELVEEIRSRCDIVDTLSQFISLQKKGSNYVCCCPFHNEKTPSFHVSRNKQMYKCFGCGEGGNVFTFLQKYENMTFPEAVEYLAPIAGVTLPEEKPTVQASLEARLFDLLLKGASLRDAVSALVDAGEKKNAVYAASLKVKEYVDV